MLYSFFTPISAQADLFSLLSAYFMRASMAFFCAFFMTMLLAPSFIRALHRFKFGQQIHSGVTLHQKKAGTPTMGGILFLFSASISTLLFADLNNINIWLTLLTFLGFGLIGLLDDMCKIKGNKNQGISAKTKYIGQTIITCIVLFALSYQDSLRLFITIPFIQDFELNLGVLYFIFALIVLTGSSNAVNLTDGLDGLATFPVFITVFVYSILIAFSGQLSLAEVFHITFVPQIYEVLIFCASLMGALLAFLWFNAQKAEVFMGDVGSLSLGALIGFLAILCKQEIILVLVGGIFVAETVSVILQTGFFRLSKGKRLFRMAPLHHHFEQLGWSESKIIARFWIISILLAFASLSLLFTRQL